ncbi:MAG: CPBP family intramembrane metalloprotease [Anaerolineales bacterium]|nr:CPBP family intramembrane metalloprotease [Anaerolineales bacterium]
MVRRIIAFYILMFFFLILLGGGAGVVGLPAELSLPQLAPGIAGLLMLIIFRSDKHQFRIWDRQTPLRRYLLAIAIPLGVGLVVYGLSMRFVEAGSDSGFAAMSPLLLVLWMPFGAFGEELGWRGYLHKYLDGRMTGIGSSLVVGLLWATMHVHFFQNGPIFMLFFALAIISLTIIMYALLQDTAFNVLLAALFHLMINVTNLLVLNRINELSFMIIYGVTWTAVSGITLRLQKDRFFGVKTSSPVPSIEQG